jgi:hypothetical protein
MNKNIAENVAQSTSNLANKVFDRVDVASEAGRVLANQGAKKTQDLLEAGIDKVNNLQGLSSRQYEQCTNALSRCLTEKPVHSAFVIAGVGALLALWLTSSNKRDRRD